MVLRKAVLAREKSLLPHPKTDGCSDAIFQHLELGCVCQVRRGRSGSKAAEMQGQTALPAAPRRPATPSPVWSSVDEAGRGDQGFSACLGLTFWGQLILDCKGVSITFEV